jgi:endo-1,3-1,4-beta-glycanase ExoK
VLGVVLPLAFIVTGCMRSTPEEDTAVQITALEPLEGSVQTGSPAIASVRVKNNGTEFRTFFVGYSVRDPTGKWYDAPSDSVGLGPGEESDSREFRTESLKTSGYYDTRVSVWSEEPGYGSEAERLADFEESSTFRVSSSREDFNAPELDASRWEATTRELGRGGLAPENVGLEDGLLRLTLPAGTLNGSEIESKDLYGPGFYAARIKVPDTPSSITGFFLYEPPDLESEIDIEIYNDTSGKILFTTYADGEQTHAETVDLPFDPTEGFHDYAFFYDEESLTFYVDGEPVQEFEDGLPDERMKLYVNSWFPKWLSGEESDSERYVFVDWIEW